MKGGERRGNWKGRKERLGAVKRGEEKEYGKTWETRGREKPGRFLSNCLSKL